MSNLAATVGDARKRLEADREDAEVAAWFAEDRERPAEVFYTLHPMVQDYWRRAFEERRIMFGNPNAAPPRGTINVTIRDPR